MIDIARRSLSELKPYHVLAFGLGFSVPISTAAVSVFALLITLWVLFNVRRLEFPVARIASLMTVKALLILLGVLFFGGVLACYNGYDPWEVSRKHLKFFLFFPLLVLFLYRSSRYAFLAGLLSAVMLALGISLVAYFLELSRFNVLGSEWAPFKNHTEHNLFVALALFGILLLLKNFRFPLRISMILYLTAVLSVLDIFYVVPGRTGQILCFILLAIIFFSGAQYNKFIRYAVLVALSASALAFIIPGTALHAGVLKAVADWNLFLNDHHTTSIGYRLRFYTVTMELIRLNDALVLGVGNGGLLASLKDMLSTQGASDIFDNPHNDYLFFLVENGLIGVAALIGIFTAAVLDLRKNSGLLRQAGFGLITCWAIGSLANSMFLDHTSGYAFISLLACLFANKVLEDSRMDRSS